MDDEIYCDQCPVYCKCDGYSTECHLENSLNDTSSIPIKYTKGLTLTGGQHTLHVRNIYIFGLVYINASFCKIHNILISLQTNINSFIIIADFKYNELKVITFLEDRIFRNIIFLDLSLNRLTTIKYSTSLFLTKLYILSIEGNPLKSIIMRMSHAKSVLHLIDMRSISNYVELYTFFTRNLYNSLNIVVYESMMCCIFNKNIQCTSNGKSRICTGLINNYTTKIIFYFITVLTLCMLLVTMTRRIVVDKPFSRNVRPRSGNKKKYYVLLLSNYLIAAILISLYFSCFAFGRRCPGQPPFLDCKSPVSVSENHSLQFSCAKLYV